MRQLAGYYLQKGKLRNYVLIIMGVYTALRISDLLQLVWGDVYNFDDDTFYSHIYVTERKTGKKKSIALNGKVLDALKLYFSIKQVAENDYLFQSNKRKNAPIGRVQAWRIIKEAALAVGLSARIACHSLRKTFGYHAWKSGVSAVLLMDIYNHTDFAVTRRYLGVTQDDLDEVYTGLVLV